MSDGDGITIIVITRPCHADYLLSRGVTRACGQDRVTPSHVTLPCVNQLAVASSYFRLNIEHTGFHYGIQ